MSHVDEGTLHALLDGALSAAAPAEAERVELHLAACADCRARLEEAARLRDEASALVGTAQPRDYVLPSFDAIRARASLAGPMLTTRPRSFLRSPFNDFAWAAMVMLALGLGWMLNDTMEGEDRGVALDARATSSPEALAESDPNIRVFEIPGASVDTLRGQATSDADASRSGADGESREVAGAPAASAERAAAYDVVAEDTEESDEAYDVVQEEAAPPPPAAFGDADRLGAVESARQRAESSPEEDLAFRVSPAAPAAQSAAPAGAGASPGALNDGWRSVSLAEAERLTGGSVVRIGGARVVSSAARGSGAELEVRTVQLTDRSESITVIQRRTPLLDARRRESIVAEAEAPARDVVTAGLTVRVEEWTVTISGEVPPERLRELAAGLS